MGTHGDLRGVIRHDLPGFGPEGLAVQAGALMSSMEWIWMEWLVRWSVRGMTSHVRIPFIPLWWSRRRFVMRGVDVSLYGVRTAGWYNVRGGWKTTLHKNLQKDSPICRPRCCADWSAIECPPPFPVGPKSFAKTRRQSPGCASIRPISIGSTVSFSIPQLFWTNNRWQSFYCMTFSRKV